MPESNELYLATAMNGINPQFISASQENRKPKQEQRLTMIEQNWKRPYVDIVFIFHLLKADCQMRAKANP